MAVRSSARGFNLLVVVSTSSSKASRRSSAIINRTISWNQIRKKGRAWVKHFFVISGY